MDNLYDKKNYLNPIPYLFSDIREYDISKANINILFAKGIIDEDKYKYLYNLPRMDRQYTIGNMCKNKNIQFMCKIHSKKTILRLQRYNLGGDAC